MIKELGVFFLIILSKKKKGMENKIKEVIRDIVFANGGDKDNKEDINYLYKVLIKILGNIHDIEDKKYPIWNNKIELFNLVKKSNYNVFLMLLHSEQVYKEIKTYKKIKSI